MYYLQNHLLVFILMIKKQLKKDAKNDGFLYLGNPVIDGFEKIRVPGEAISIQIILESGDVAVGDCAAVQYSGAGGRDPLFLADLYIPFLEEKIKPLLLAETITTFKELAEKYDNLYFDGKKMHTAIRYGLSQALA
jgi:methylaspartate ammonia-lyase